MIKNIIILILVFFPQIMSSQDYKVRQEGRQSIDNLIMSYNDSIGFTHIPRVLGACYYSIYKKPANLIEDVFVDVEIGQPSLTRIYTKYAKSGYLYVNELVSDSIRKNGLRCDSISYYIKDLEITNCKSVRRLIKLKKKNIREVDIKYADGIVIANILLK